MRHPDITRPLVVRTLTESRLGVIIVVHGHGEVIAIGQTKARRGKIWVTWDVARDTHCRIEMLATIRAAAIEYIPLASTRIHPPQAHISWTRADSKRRERVFYANGSIRNIPTGRIGLTLVGRA